MYFFNLRIDHIDTVIYNFLASKTKTVYHVKSKQSLTRQSSQKYPLFKNNNSVFVPFSACLSSLQCLEHCEVQHLFEDVLPAMVNLALSAPRLCTMVSALILTFWNS